MGAQRKILAALVLAAAIQIVHYYPLLPYRVASHFDGTGRANSWMPKDGFILVYVSVITLLAILFTVVPKLIERSPDSAINLPNKKYWLASERRAETFETIQRHISAAGNVAIAFMLCVFQLAFMANLEADGRLSGAIWPLLVVFVILMIAWTIKFTRAFRLPRDPSAPLS